MFDIGWSELLVIGVVALVAIGPKELPGVLRAVGQWTSKIRRMAAEFQGQFHEAMREIEMADLKKQVDEAASGLDSKFDPLDIKNSAWTPNSTPSTPPAGTGGSDTTPPSGTPEPPAAAPGPSGEGAGAVEARPDPAGTSTAPNGEGSRPA